MGQCQTKWASVKQNGPVSDKMVQCQTKWASVKQHGPVSNKMGHSVKQNGPVSNKMGQCSTIWASVKQNGLVSNKMCQCQTNWARWQTTLVSGKQTDRGVNQNGLLALKRGVGQTKLALANNLGAAAYKTGKRQTNGRGGKQNMPVANNLGAAKHTRQAPRRLR